MQTEIEAKSLAVDHDALRVKLRDLGATLDEDVDELPVITFEEVVPDVLARNKRAIS
jgi:hypothetical protein